MLQNSLHWFVVAFSWTHPRCPWCTDPIRWRFNGAPNSLLIMTPMKPLESADQACDSSSLDPRRPAFPPQVNVTFCSDPSCGKKWVTKSGKWSGYVNQVSSEPLPRDPTVICYILLFFLMIVGLDFGLFAVWKVQKVGFGCNRIKDSEFFVKILLLNHYFDGKNTKTSTSGLETESQYC